VTTFQASIHNDYDARMAYAEQELYEKNAALKEEQLQMSKTRLKWLALILALSVMTVGILIYSNRLKHEKYTIEAVAFDACLGFRSTFQRLFHKQFGLSPNDYRKLLNEK
jgi:AraC-like DNA-binding protein